MFWNKTYFADEWEIQSSTIIEHDWDGDFGGYTMVIMLRNLFTGKPKQIKIGNSFWTYDSVSQLRRAVFLKTGMELRADDELHIPKRPYNPQP